MPRFHASRQTKRRRGNTIAEMPLGMLLIFLGIGFPMLLGCAIGYKVMLVYYAIRDACTHGAKCGSWSDRLNPVTNQNTLGVPNEVAFVINKDLGFYKNVVSTSPTPIITCTIWQQPIGGGAGSTVSNTTLSNADETKFNYSLQVQYDCQIEPFLYKGWNGWMGKVPGLSAPFPMSVRYQTYCENPKGLAS
ncbi:MAG TPA: hypothetical protein V6C72_03150 [Chroococcales cyanobacterium]